MRVAVVVLATWGLFGCSVSRMESSPTKADQKAVEPLTLRGKLGVINVRIIDAACTSSVLVTEIQVRNDSKDRMAFAGTTLAFEEFSSTGKPIRDYSLEELIIKPGQSSAFGSVFELPVGLPTKKLTLGFLLIAGREEWNAEIPFVRPCP